MADESEDEGLDGQQVEIEVRKFSDDEFGIVFKTDRHPGPEKSPGFWLDVDRTALEDLFVQVYRALKGSDPKTVDEAAAEVLEVEKALRRNLN